MIALPRKIAPLVSRAKFMDTSMALNVTRPEVKQKLVRIIKSDPLTHVHSIINVSNMQTETRMLLNARGAKSSSTPYEIVSQRSNLNLRKLERGRSTAIGSDTPNTSNVKTAVVLLEIQTRVHVVETFPPK